jgi:hypothetical protein
MMARIDRSLPAGADDDTMQAVADISQDGSKKLHAAAA